MRGIIGDARKLRAIAEERDLREDEKMEEENDGEKEKEEKMKAKKKKVKKRKKYRKAFQQKTTTLHAFKLLNFQVNDESLNKPDLFFAFQKHWQMTIWRMLRRGFILIGEYLVVIYISTVCMSYIFLYFRYLGQISFALYRLNFAYRQKVGYD